MNPNRKRLIGEIIGSIAALLAFVSIFFSAAPFTPAVVINFITIPIGVTAIFFQAWRNGSLAIYWALSAFLVFPTVLRSVQFECVLIAVLIVGLALCLFLLHNYRKTQQPG